MFTHEDNRRTLYEWAVGNYRECKAVVMKEGGTLGNHWHAKKDEVFLLLSGKAVNVQIGDNFWVNMDAPHRWEVPRGTWHRFELTAGSVLLGAATEAYDKEDERTDEPRPATAV